MSTDSMNDHWYHLRLLGHIPLSKPLSGTNEWAANQSTGTLHMNFKTSVCLFLLSLIFTGQVPAEDPSALSSHDALEKASKRPRICLGAAFGHALDQLITLQVLNLSNNQLTGGWVEISVQIIIFLPTCFKPLSWSDVFATLSYTAGEIPESLGSLFKLTELNLGHNQLTGA